MAGHLRNVSNLFVGGTNTALCRNNHLIGGCLTAKAGKMLEQMNKVVANGMSGASNSDRLKSSYSPNKSEIHDNNTELTVYKQAKNQKETRSEVRPTAQAVMPPQSMQNVNSVDYPTYTINGQKYKGVYDESGNEYWLPKEGYDEIIADRMNSSTWYGRSMNLFGQQGYERDVYGLSAEGNTFWDSMPQGVKDIIQSDAVRSLSVSAMDNWPSEEDWKNMLEEIKELNIRQLTGTAAKIMSILSVVTPNPGIAALHIVLGLCVVAQEVQEARRKEKERLEGLNSPEWNEAAIKAELDRQVPIWFRNKAMEFFVGEWLGKVTKFITTDKFKRVVIDQGRESFLDYYKRMLMARKDYQEILAARSQIGIWTGVVEDAYKKKQDQGNSREY